MDAAKRISILGSTGSIGTQALEVAEFHHIEVVGLAAHSNVKLLETQVRAFKPQVVCAVNEKAAADLKIKLADTDCKVLSGKDGLCQVAAMEADTVLNAVVGMAGLTPTLAAIEAGRQVALANKETLVAGGNLVMEAAQRKGVEILPVDSEHSAIFQCLRGNERRALKKVLLTASGGPFRGMGRNRLATVTREQALRHPNWSMGYKVTVDSATMMNKGLEAIEAKWLFNLKAEEIEIIIHPQSILHSAVEYKDGSIIAQLGAPDMRLPIQYALLYPKRMESPAETLSLTDAANLTFQKPDPETFLALKAAYIALAKGDSYACALNAANEVAVNHFLSGYTSFLSIGDFLIRVLDRNLPSINSLEELLELDAQIRELSESYFANQLLKNS